MGDDWCLVVTLRTSPIKYVRDTLPTRYQGLRVFYEVEQVCEEMEPLCDDGVTWVPRLPPSCAYEECPPSAASQTGLIVGTVVAFAALTLMIVGGIYTAYKLELLCFYKKRL